MKKRFTFAALAAAVALSAAACSGPGATPASSAPSGAPSAATASAASTGSTDSAAAEASWTLNPDGAAERIRAAGLPILAAEGTVEHYHAHLDVLVDGQPITVPAGIGFSFGADGQPNGISSVHTHDTTGVIHIEAATAGQHYTLGQVLKEWGVYNGSGDIGPEHDPAGGSWMLYVNGTEQPGPVDSVELHPHDEIAMVYGSAPAQIPASYSFAAGL